MSTAPRQQEIEDVDFSCAELAMARFISASKMDWKWNTMLHEVVQKEATVAGTYSWRYIFEDEELRAYFEGLFGAPASHHRFWLLPSPTFFAAGMGGAKSNRERGQYLLFQEETLHPTSPSAPLQPQSPAGLFSNQAPMAWVLLSQQIQPHEPFSGWRFQDYFSSALAVEKSNYSGLVFKPEVSEVELAPLGLANKPPTKPDSKAELETIFKGLAKAWKEGTFGCSITTRRYAHSSYQAILVLGPDVVPFMLRELQERPDWWFEALKALTKADPTKPTDNFNDAVKAWLNWGREQRLLP